VERLVARQFIPAAEGQRAIEAMQGVIKRLPASAFDDATLPAMAELLAAAEKPTQ
jgi:hypothetical protein